jgi:hypothetical protein
VPALDRARPFLQVHLEGVEQHREHGEVAQAADDVDQAGLDRLLVVGVPRVLRVEVAGRDQQRQLTEPLVDAGIEPAVRAER